MLTVQHLTIHHTLVHLVSITNKASADQAPGSLYEGHFKMSRPSQTFLANRLRQLSLNSPSQTALFYARFFNALCPSENDHESAHILALCLLEVGEAYSALHVVRARAGSGCRACAMLVARCSQTLGRFSEGQAVLEYTLRHGFGSTGNLFVMMS